MTPARQPRNERGSKYARGGTAALAVTACLLCAPGCGRWGYGALAELAGADAAEVAASSGPITAPDAPRVLDAGSLRLAEGAVPLDGWIRPPRALGVEADASVEFDAGPARSASCDELPQLAAPPTLDGRLEAGLAVQPVPPQNWTGSGSLPPGHSLSFAAAWHAQGLYFYLEVLDPDRLPAEPSSEVWQGDGVEIYVDHDAVFAAAGSYDDPGTRQLIFTAPASDVQNGERADAYIAPAGRVAALAASDWIATPTPTGYAIEVAVSAAVLGLSSWTLSAGSQVGFDLAHNISAPLGEAGVQGNRAGQYFLRVGPQTDVSLYPFYNSGVFCAPTLLP